MGIAASYFVEARLCALFGSLAAWFRYLGSHYDIASAGPDCKSHFVVRIVFSASNPDCWILHIQYSYDSYVWLFLVWSHTSFFFVRRILVCSAREFHVSLLSCLTTESYWILLFSSIESLLSSPNSVVNFPLYTVDSSFSMFHISLMFRVVVLNLRISYHISFWLIWFTYVFFLTLNLIFHVLLVGHRWTGCFSTAGPTHGWAPRLPWTAWRAGWSGAAACNGEALSLRSTLTELWKITIVSWVNHHFQWVNHHF